MNDCLFCKIIAKELPSFIVYEDDVTLAFLDINPVNPGHVLVIPKKHATNIFDIDAESWSRVAESVRKVAVALERGVGCDGVNLMMNNREHAGQVIDHPHVHLIPRYKDDGLKLWPHKKYQAGEAETLQEKIRAAIS